MKISTMKSTTVTSKKSTQFGCLLSFLFYMRNDRYQVKFDDGFDNVIVVDGVPIIDKSKLDKLLARIAKEFSRKGAPIKVDDIFVPWDDSTGKSKGCVF